MIFWKNYNTSIQLGVSRETACHDKCIGQTAALKTMFLLLAQTVGIGEDETHYDSDNYNGGSSSGGNWNDSEWRARG